MLCFSPFFPWERKSVLCFSRFSPGERGRG
jgi:hypothetical protein